ncbi:hypothetical protein C3L33_22178, partial [Rhododendron williamsianum]
MSKILSLPAISSRPNPNPDFPNPHRHRRSQATTLARSSLTDQSLSAAAAKRDLLDLISDQDRGLRTQNDPSRLSKIVEAIDALAVSGRDTVTTGPSLSGTWRLMWTTEKEQLFIIKNAYLFGTRTGDVLQVIDVDEGVLNNVITFPPHGVFFVRSTVEIASTQRVNFSKISCNVVLQGLQVQFYVGRIGSFHYHHLGRGEKFFFISGEGWEYQSDEVVGPNTPGIQIVWGDPEPSDFRRVENPSPDIDRLIAAMRKEKIPFEELVNPQKLFDHLLGPNPAGNI